MPGEFEFRAIVRRCCAATLRHRQVTDAYLAALAEHHDAVVATLDRGIALLHPDATLLIDDLRRQQSCGRRHPAASIIHMPSDCFGGSDAVADTVNGCAACPVDLLAEQPELSDRRSAR